MHRKSFHSMLHFFKDGEVNIFVVFYKMYEIIRERCLKGAF